MLEPWRAPLVAGGDRVVIVSDYRGFRLEIVAPFVEGAARRAGYLPQTDGD